LPSTVQFTVGKYIHCAVSNIIQDNQLNFLSYAISNSFTNCRLQVIVYLWIVVNQELLQMHTIIL
jgi:hypothetical protein